MEVAEQEVVELEKEGESFEEFFDFEKVSRSSDLEE